MKRWFRALLAALVALGVPAGGAAADAPKPAPPTRVILVTLDTTRADHLPMYGYPRQTAPFLSGLAQRGVVYEKMFAASSHTSPCHASLFTSLLPDQHQILMNGQAFGSNVNTLASEFAAAGYKTAGFTSVRFLKDLSKGFETIATTPASVKGARPANQTIDQAITWAASQPRDQKYFLWVHLFDAHDSKPFDTKFDKYAEQIDLDAGTVGEKQWQKYLVDNQGLPANKLRKVAGFGSRIKSYDARIRFMDEQLARLHDAVSGPGAPPSVWLVTADHGEGMGGHGHMGHGLWLYDEQVHVPCILAFSDHREAGRRVSGLTHQVDIMPMLCQLIGRPRQSAWEGRLRVPFSESEGTNEIFITRRPCYDHEAKSRRRYALRTDDWKLIWSPAGEGEELFDLKADPRELKNVAATNPSKAAEMRRRLADIVNRVVPKANASAEPAISKENMEELKSLGYLQ